MNQMQILLIDSVIRHNNVRCEWISKIPFRSWQAWKNWFFVLRLLWLLPFFDPSHLNEWSKKGPSQKSYYNETSVFSCLTTTKNNFWNPYSPVLYFENFFLELLLAATIPGVEIFNWKSACVVFFNMQNWNFRAASES